MSDPSPTGNILSIIEEAHRPGQVASWFLARGWSRAGIAGGPVLVRSGGVELVISPGPPARHGGRQVLVRGFLRDAAADGPRIARIIEAARVSHRTRWGDLDGDGWSGASAASVTRYAPGMNPPGPGPGTDPPGWLDPPTDPERPPSAG